MSAFVGEYSILDKFIESLSYEITPIPPAEREKIIDRYVAHFDECKACNMTDEAILDRIGDPVSLGRAYVAHSLSGGVTAVYPPIHMQGRSPGRKFMWAVLLGGFSIIFVYPILLPLVLSMAAGTVACFVGVAASAIALLSLVFEPLKHFVNMGNFPVFANVLICAGTFFASYALTQVFSELTKGMAKIIRVYSAWFSRKVRGY